MANIVEPTKEMTAAWQGWLATRPAVIREMGERLVPWKLYRMKSTGHRVTVVSFFEDSTVRVNVSAEYNLLSFERQVFGIAADDLEECELPPSDEPVGEFMTPDEQVEYINERRAENGLSPLDEERE